jgi:hypothetical protein
MSGPKKNQGQEAPPFDMAQLLAQMMAKKGGTDLSSALGDPFLAFISGRFQGTPKLSEGELFERYAPEFFYIMENEPEGSWKKSAASSIAQGVPAYVVKDNLRQQILTNPNTFGLSTSKEVDAFVDGLDGSYARVRTKLLEQESELDPFQKQGFPSASQRYSDEDIFRMGASGFQEIMGGISKKDTSYGRALKGLQERHQREKINVEQRSKYSPTYLDWLKTGSPPEKWQELYDKAAAAAEKGVSFSYNGKTYTSSKEIVENLLPRLKKELDYAQQLKDYGEYAKARGAQMPTPSAEETKQTGTPQPRDRNAQFVRQKEERVLKQYNELLEKYDKAKSGTSSGRTRNRGSVSYNAEEIKSQIDALVSENPWVSSGVTPSASQREKTEKSAAGVAEAPKRLSPQETLDYKYKRMAEMASRKRGGEQHAEESAQAYFNKLAGGLEASGRSPLMDALMNAAIMKRMMGG